MVETDRIAERISCPYFREARPHGRQIRCEGPTEGSRLLLTMTGRARYEAQLENYCCAYPTACPIAAMLDGVNGV